MTQEEFQDNFKCLHDVAKAKLLEATGDASLKPLFVYDNVALQKTANYGAMSIERTQHVQTPPHSPDFNKPIEHCWNQIKSKVLSKLYRAYDVELTAALAQQMVQEAWNEIKRDSIRRDVESLKDTWLIVKTPTNNEVTTSRNEQIQGSGGDYPGTSTYR
jgi:transposase